MTEEMKRGGRALEIVLRAIAKASGGPYIGPKGGKWADPQHTIPWHQPAPGAGHSPRSPEKRATTKPKLTAAAVSALKYLSKYGMITASSYGTSSGVNDSNGDLHEHGRVTRAVLRSMIQDGLIEIADHKQGYASVPAGAFGRTATHGYKSVPTSETTFKLTEKGREAIASMAKSQANDASAMFDERAIDSARRQTGARSRHTIVSMPIDHFLGMAEPGIDESKQRDVEDLAARGSKFDSIPNMRIDDSGDVAQVVGHDGRHRARALKKRGFTHMPVLITSPSTRWSEQHSPTRDDYKKEWPSRLVSQDGSSSMPYPLGRDGKWGT